MAGNLPSEQAALARVAGVQRTRAELETLALIASYDVVEAQIATHSKEERQEIGADAVSMVNMPAHVEARRAATWLAAAPAARKVALMAANINPARHKDGLRTFDAFERGMVWVALGKLTKECDAIRRAMTGGEVKSHAGAGHAANGITDIGGVL